MRIHTGYTQDESGRTRYYVDDVDALDCEIREYGIMDVPVDRWPSLLNKLQRNEEAKGFNVVISIGDFFYETHEEEKGNVP